MLSLCVVAKIVIEERTVADLDRVRAARDLDDRGDVAWFAACAVLTEVGGEALRVDGSGGDDDLEFGAARQELREVAEDEVDVEGALVGLVDDEGVVAQQVRVGLDFGEKDAVCHELDQRVWPDFFCEAHLVADRAAELYAQFVADAFSNRACGDTARLGVADEAGDTAAELETDLG